MDSAASDPEAIQAELLQAGYRFAYALTHHHEEAEDLVQETWLNLSRRYGGVENRAVLFSSIRNLFIDHCRRKKRVAFDSLDDPELSDPPGEAPAVEPGVQGELKELLAKLKPGEREVVFLHYYLGHTAEEIAQMNKQSRGTVLSLLHRSMAKLRQFSKSVGLPNLRNQLMLWFVLLLVMTCRLPRP